MARDDQDNKDYLDDREDPDPEDADWNMDPATIECPYCGGNVTEESEYCPRCDRFLSNEDAPARRSYWLVAGVVLLILLVVAGLLWI